MCAVQISKNTYSECADSWRTKYLQTNISVLVQLKMLLFLDLKLNMSSVKLIYLSSTGTGDSHVELACFRGMPLGKQQ